MRLIEDHHIDMIAEEYFVMPTEIGILYILHSQCKHKVDEVFAQSADFIGLK